MDEDRDILNVPWSWTRPPNTPELDRHRADAMVGKYALIGITHLNSSEQPVRKQQIHGVIIAIDETQGIVVQRSDESLFHLPPDLDQLQPAAPGCYHLRETGETVEDPDFVGFVTVTPPVSQGN